MLYRTPSDDPADKFADAILDFCHSLGWMVSRQRELDRSTGTLNTFAAVDTAADDEFDAESRRHAAEVSAEIEPAWADVQQDLAKMKTMVFMPPHAVDGASPAEWRYAILCDMDEAAALIGGPFKDSPRMGYPSASDRDRAATILDRLSDQRVREARNFSIKGETPAPTAQTTGWPNQAAVAKLFGKDAGVITRWREKGDLLDHVSDGKVLINPLSIVRLLMREKEEEAGNAGPAPIAASAAKTQKEASLPCRCGLCGQIVRPRCPHPGCGSRDLRPV